MKRFAMTLILTVATSAILLAQAPEGISYQAIARDGSGLALINQSVDVRFSVREGNPLGTVVYEETHNTATNDFGLITLLVGQGNANIGTFNNIDWGNNSFYLQVEMDAGKGYVDLGTTQMMSVPYALYAKEAGNAGKDYNAGSGIDITNETITNTGDVDASDDMLKGDAAAGDLAGTYPNPIVTQIQGKPISTDVPAAGQVLKWDGLKWVPAADDAGNGSTIWSLQGNDAYYTNGNVGVGINTPTHPLEVEGDVRLANQGEGFDLYVNAHGELEISPDGATKASITVDDDNDFVGFFGHTPINGSTSFDVNSDAVGTNYGGMYVNTKGDSAKPFYGYATDGTAKAWTYYDGITNQIRINNDGDHMVVTKTGNVGIGTTNPARPLSVEGKIRLSNQLELFDMGVNVDGQLEILKNGVSSPATITVDDNSNYIGLFGQTPISGNSNFDVHTGATGTNYGGMFVNTASTDAKPFYGYGTSGAAKAWTYYDGVTGNWQLYNGGNQMTVTNTGRVGIGTTAPNAYLLHLRDDQSGIFSTNTALIESVKDDDMKTMLEFQANANVPGHKYAIAINRGLVQTTSIDVEGKARLRQMTTWLQTSQPDEKTLYGNSLPLAYGHITSGGSPGNTKYGIDNVAKTATGTYTITLLNASEWTPAVMITPYDAGTGGEIANYSYDSNTNTITVIITEHNGAKTDSDFAIVVFGWNEF